YRVRDLAGAPTVRRARVSMPGKAELAGPGGDGAGKRRDPPATTGTRSDRGRPPQGPPCAEEGLRQGYSDGAMTAEAPWSRSFCATASPTCSAALASPVDVASSRRLPSGRRTAARSVRPCPPPVAAAPIGT